MPTALMGFRPSEVSPPRRCLLLSELAPSSALLSTSEVLVRARVDVAPPFTVRSAPKSGSEDVRKCASFSERALEGLRPTWESVLVSAGLAA
jgi:hypothetical protein